MLDRFAKFAVKRLATKAGYRVVDQPITRGGGPKRPFGRIETVGEEGILTPYKRQRVISLARDMLRNSPQARGMAKTLRVNVIGDRGKLRFYEYGKWYKDARSLFKRWARHADFRDHSTFRECLQLAVVTIAFEGDFVCIFDDGCLTGGNGTGRLAFFTSDQICNLDEAGFAPFRAMGFSQDSGVICDRFGRKAGVVVSRHHGRTETPREDAFVLLMDPDDPDAASWRHVTRKFRLVQKRGVADAVTTQETVLDSSMMLDYELQTAKAAAANYMLLVDPPDAPKHDAPSLEEIGIDENGAEKPGEESDKTRLDPFDFDGGIDYAAGRLDTAPNGTTAIFPPGNRPNVNLPAFIDWTNDLAGLAHGLTHSWSRGRAEGSYTAFRGDLVMAQGTFTDLQQFIEDAFSDAVAVWVIERAVRLGQLDAAPKDWRDAIAWQYPELPEVDEGKAESAFTAGYRNGGRTLLDRVGPDWPDILEQQGRERAAAEKAGVGNLAIFQGTPGAGEAKPSGTDGNDNGDNGKTEQ